MSPDQAGLVQSTMRAENGRSSFTIVTLRLHFIIATRNWLRLGLERWFWEMWRHVRNSSPFCVAAFLRTPQDNTFALSKFQSPFPSMFLPLAVVEWRFLRLALKARASVEA